MFEHMPQVPKGKIKFTSQTPKRPRRIPTILGLLGFLVLLALLGVAAFGGWYFLAGPGASTAKNISAPSQPVAKTAPGATVPAVAFNVPRGKIAFSVERGAQPDDKTVWVMNTDGSGAKKVFDRASSPALSPSGNLIAFYRWNDGIYVANVDGTNVRKVVAETNAKYFSWTHDDQWIAFSSQPIQKEGMNVNIDAVTVDGSQRRTIVNGGSNPSFSPDDKEIVFHTCREGNCGIYKASAYGGDAAMIVGEMGGNPAWSPDGKRIVYHADTDTVKQIFVVNADGSGKQQLTTGMVLHVDPIWSPDSNMIYYRSPEGGSWGIWRINADGSNPVKVAESGPPVDWAYERVAISW